MGRNMRTLAVAVRTATHPSTGQPIFELGDDEMEIGMGQHGEAGTGRMQLKSADETAEIMLDMLLEDLRRPKPAKNCWSSLNGAGATTLMELLIRLPPRGPDSEAKKIKLARSAVGEFITTQEQAGFQLMIARMDRELIDLWDAPANAPFFVKAMNDVICISDLRRMFAEAAKRIRQDQAMLSQLDCIGGDGDHGTTMVRAMKQLEDAMKDENAKPLNARLKDAGWSVLGVDGGASSAILGSFIAGMGDAEMGQESDCGRLAASLDAGLQRGAEADQGHARRQDHDGCVRARGAGLRCGGKFRRVDCRTPWSTPPKPRAGEPTRRRI